MLDLTPCEMCSGRDFTLCRSPVRLKEENRYYCDLSGATVLYDASPKCLSVDLKPYHLLHGCVGCTADVTGDHHQNARMKARHHSSQIDLEPPLKVFRLKDFKFRSKGRQGQIQDGVSYLWICYDGDVSLEIKGIHLSVQEDILPFWNRCRNERKLGDTPLHIKCISAAVCLKASWAPIHSTNILETYHFQSNLGPLLAYAKIPGAQDKIYMVYLSSNFIGKYGNLKVKHSPACWCL